MSTLPRSPLLAGSLLALVCCLAVAACQTVPYTGRKQAVVLSDADAARLGDEAFAEILSEESLIREGGLYEQIQSVARRVIGNAPPEFAGLDWTVELIDSEEINAFALPGGNVGVYTGILPVLKNEAALASVTGHEVGHVVGRHSSERVTRAMVLQLGIAAADIGLSNVEVHDQLLALLGLGATVGVELPYSRANELEADQLGGILMAQAGYDPRESWAVWERMQAQKGAAPPAFLSTHPSDEERIARLKEELPTFERYYDAAPEKRGRGASLQLGASKSKSK